MTKINSIQFLKLLLVSSIFLFVSCDSDDDNSDSTNEECTSVTIPDADIINLNTEDVVFDSNLISLFHNNINVSDFAAATEFYELLGFTNVFGASGVSVPLNISDPNEALGINLEPYQLNVSILVMNDGFVLNMIKYNSPFNDEAPNDDIFDLGLSALNLKTDNLLSDIAVFEANNIEYSILNGTEEAPTKISFTDPSGTIVLLTEVPTSVDAFTGLNNSGQTSIYGLFTININVSNLEEAIDFYTEVGFSTVSVSDRIATIAIPDGRHISLTESCNTNIPYADANHLGIARIALETIDIDADIERLNANGIETYTPEAITPSTSGFDTVRYVAFEDPDGIIVELIETIITE